MFTVPSRIVPPALRLQGRNRNYLTPELARAHLEELRANPRSITPPTHLRGRVRVTRDDAHGWPVFRMTREAPAAPRGRIVYFHGGGYVHGIHAAHWSFLAHLVRRTAREAVIPLYPLVTEGGTAWQAAQVAAQLSADAGDGAILMGDSAGAQIAFSAAVTLRDRGARVPLTVLISPPIDLELRHPGLAERAPLDPWLCRDGMAVFSELWLADHGFAHPLNPINADPTGLGPMLIFSGTLDILNLDAAPWVRTLRSRGVDVEFHEPPGEVHVYPLLPTRPGRRARRRIVAAITERTPS